MTAPISPDDWEILSAYLDGQASDREKEQIRVRLDAQPELQRALEELRRTRMVLRSAPRKRVPHNFTLTRAMVPQRKPWFRLVPSLSLASGLATFLLILTFAFEFLPGLSRSFQPLAAQAPALPNASAQKQSGVQSTAAPDTYQPSNEQGAPIVVWGSGATGMGGGGGGSAIGGGAPDTLPPAASNIETTPETGIGGGPTPAGGAEPLPTEAAGTEVTPPPDASQAVVAAPSQTPEVQQYSTAESATPVPPQAAAPLSGGGPILGIRPTEEMGKIVVDQGVDLTPAAVPTRAPVPAQSFLSRNLVLIQVGLVLLAIAAGVAAFFLRRRF